MLPLRDLLPARRVPYVSRGLILVCALVYFATAPELEQAVRQYGAVAFHFTGFTPALLESEFGIPHDIAPVPDDGTAWVRAVTHMFLHGGLLHLASNMWFLWLFGDNVEDRLGHARFTLLYFVSGGVALASQIVADPHSGVPMVGASGAISGVLGAYLVFFPRAIVVTLVPLGFIPLLVELPAMFFLLYWMGLQLLRGFLDAGVTGVAWWAHVGGFAAGALLAKPLAPRLRPKRRLEIRDG